MRKLVFVVPGPLSSLIGRSLVCLVGILLAGVFTTVAGQRGIRKPEAGVVVERRKPVPYSVELEIKPSARCQISIYRDARLLRRLDTTQFVDRPITTGLFKGTYTLDLACEGFQADSKVLKIPEDYSEPVSFRLIPLLTVVIINTTPSACEVLLDGYYQGFTDASGRLTLPPLKPGKFGVVVRSPPEYSQAAFVLSVPEDGPSINVKLERSQFFLKIESLKTTVAAGQTAEALTLYEELLAAGVSTSRLQSLQKELMQQVNLRSLATLASLSPDGLRVLLKSLLELRDFHSRLRTILKESWDSEPALNLFALFWELKWLEARITSTEADRLLNVSQIKAVLNRIALLQPADASIRFELGWSYFRLGESIRAQTEFDEARRARPEWSFPYVGLGHLKQAEAYSIPDKQRYRKVLLEAAGLFEEAIKRESTNVAGYVGAVFSYADSGQPARGVKLGMEALIIAPQSGLLKFALGYAYYADKKYKTAQQYFADALKAPKDNLNPSQVLRVGELLKLVAPKAK